PGFFGDRDFALLRLLPDGSPDPLFGTNGLTTTTFGTAFDDANTLVITPENKAVLVGMSAQTNNDFAIARYFLGPVIDGVDNMALTPLAHPNPTSGPVYFTAPSMDGQWAIYDALGHMVLSGPAIAGRRIQVDLAHYPRGLYFLDLNGGHAPSRQRILLIN
ncbi:MAG: hypothetical protein L7S67_05775, partial [Flavobacteriales bacterium]|nr:hypothetical protein [Flavobacteriales bacterium]